MSDWYTFVKWELASRKTIDFKMIYVDVAGGDILAGLLLSQIIYWNLPNKEGHQKLRIQKENKLWLARKHSDWYQEIRMSEDQVRRALNVLQDLQLVEVKRFKFDGAPTIHISLNRNVIAHAVKKLMQTEQKEQQSQQSSDLGQNPNGFGPEPKWIWDKTQMDLGQNPVPLTEITTEITNIDLNTPFNPPMGETREVKKVLCGRCSRFKPNTQDLEGKNYCLTCLPYELEERRIVTEMAISTMPQTTDPKTTSTSSGTPHSPPGFDEFWQQYPAKVAKPAALRAWKKLKPGQDLQATILHDIAKRKQTDRKWVEGFIPNPATYLNQARWEDDIQLLSVTRSIDVGSVHGRSEFSKQPLSQHERNMIELRKYAEKHGVSI